MVNTYRMLIHSADAFMKLPGIDRSEEGRGLGRMVKPTS